MQLATSLRAHDFTSAWPLSIEILPRISKVLPKLRLNRCRSTSVSLPATRLKAYDIDPYSSL